MSTAEWRIAPSVIKQLFEEPYRFQFFQAMRILEHFYRLQGVKKDEIISHKLRFRNTLSLSFPASDLHSADIYSSEGDLLEGMGNIMRAVEAGDIGDVHIVPSFMGLLGSTGALPLHYTELLAEREVYRRDRTARAFLDIFTTRAVALHYGAWKKYRLAFQYELYNEERFLPILLYLAGVGLPGLRSRMVDGQGDVFDQAVGYYSGTIRERPVSAVMLQHILSDYFSASIKVEQFVGMWYRVPERQRTRLGGPNASLGMSALAGERIWQRDLRMRLLIGPLDRESFNAFLPGGDAEGALTKWLTLMTGSCLEYEVRLVLRAEDVRPASIGGPGSARLGWDSFLCSRPVDSPRADTCYTLHTMQ